MENTLGDKSKQYWLIVIVAASIFMFSFDYSVLNVSLPTIAHSFNVSVGVMARLPLVYLLIVTSTLLGFGKMGDEKGLKKMFLIGVGVFTAGSVMSGLSINNNMLLGARVLQSVGEAMFSPTGIALVSGFLPQDMRGKSMGIIGTAQGVGFSLGPIIGGFINSHLVWRWIFALNVPIGIVVILLGLKMLPGKRADAGDKPSRPFDLPGAVFIFFALAGLLVALNNGEKMGWTNPVILAGAGFFIIFTITLVIREKAIDYPVLDFQVFKNRNFLMANLAAFFGIASYIGLTFIFPFYLTLVKKIQPDKMGLIMMIPSLLMMLLGPFAGKTADRMGSRAISSVGLALVVAAFVLLFTMKTGASLVFIGFYFVLLGTGVGLFLAPNGKLIMKNAPEDKRGVASGVMKTFQNVGSVFGICVFQIVLAQAILLNKSIAHVPLQQAKEMIRNSPDVIHQGFHLTFLFGIIIAVFALIFSLLSNDAGEVEKQAG